MPEWLIPVGIGVIVVSLVGVIWKMHAQRDDERNEDLWDTIGRDSDSGMRGKSHRNSNRIARLAARLWRLEEKNNLPPWKDEE